MNQNNFHDLLGTSNNLPKRQQSFYNKKQKEKDHKIPNTTDKTPKWWDKLGDSDDSDTLFSSSESSFDLSDNSVSYSEKALSTKKNRENLKVIKEPKRLNKLKEKKNTIKPRRMSFSDDSGLGAYQPNSVPLLNLDEKSPFIWGMGTFLIFFLVLAASIHQSGGIVPTQVNPFIGPDISTLLLFGGKDGYFILKGDWWRFFTAIFIHSGLIHLILSLLFILATINVEKDS